MSKEAALTILRAATDMAAKELDMGEDSRVLGYLTIIECHVPTQGRRLVFVGGDADDNMLPFYTVGHYLDTCLSFMEEAVDANDEEGGE